VVTTAQSPNRLESGSDAVVDGTVTSYGTPFKAFVDEVGASWTSWCASSSWFPKMFNNDFTLAVGENYMGGFTKDWLYEKRESNLATGTP
jgi:endoglucanase